MLEKFEPNDLNDSFVPSMSYFDNKGDSVCAKMMKQVWEGEDVKDSLNELFSDLIR